MVNVRPDLEPGQIFAGKYRIERVLGAGGMGIVVAATHLALDERVAIKLMLGAGKPAAVRRFVREARVTVRLKGPHVARVFDIAALDDGTPFIVMEYLEGKDLSELLREHGRLPIRAAIDAILQAAEALAEAHALGIVHRDLKPANVFLACSPGDSACIKVLDFGIAKWTRSGTEQLELSGVMGSAPYMAPEQIAAPEQVDARTDVWGLGATLFHLLTGTTPFQHERAATPHAMIHAVMHKAPLPPRSLRPALAPEIESVLLRCLQKDPAARFQSMTALRNALAPFGSAALPAALHAPIPAAPAAPHPRSGARRLAIGAAATMPALAAIAAIAAALLDRTPAASGPSEPRVEPAAATVTAARPAPEPAPDDDRPSEHAAPPAAARRTAPGAIDGATAVRPGKHAPATTTQSLPRIAPPPRGVSSTPATPAPAGTPADTSRPKELYGERR
jgi:serine/threonine-protein kinase